MNINEMVQIIESTDREEDCRKGLEQKYPSDSTSINKNKLPAIFTYLNKKDLLKDGSYNFDIGGGKFDNATEYLAKQGVTNLIYDKFNRSESWNNDILNIVKSRKAETCTISNVLNVICEDVIILDLLRMAKKYANITYITVYQDKKKSAGANEKRKSYQRHAPIIDYVDLCKQVFKNVGLDKSKGVIICN